MGWDRERPVALPPATPPPRHPPPRSTVKQKMPIPLHFLKRRAVELGIKTSDMDRSELVDAIERGNKAARDEPDGEFFFDLHGDMDSTFPPHSDRERVWALRLNMLNPGVVTQETIDRVRAMTCDEFWALPDDERAKWTQSSPETDKNWDLMTQMADSILSRPEKHTFGDLYYVELCEGEADVVLQDDDVVYHGSSLKLDGVEIVPNILGDVTAAQVKKALEQSFNDYTHPFFEGVRREARGVYTSQWGS